MVPGIRAVSASDRADLLWLGGTGAPFHLHGLVPLIVAILLPRVLVLYMIYMDQGITLWFAIHLVAALLAWGGSGELLFAATAIPGRLNGSDSITDGLGGTSLGVVSISFLRTIP